LQFCQQKRVSGADLLAVKRIDHNGRKLGQFQTRSHKRGCLSRAGGDLFNGVFRLFQVEKSAEAVRLLHRMHIGANQILD
jgi:hypothetical protein